MDWLAGLSIEWVLFVAFAMTFARLGLHAVRKSVGPKTEMYAGEWIESLLCAWVVMFLFFRPFLFEQFRIPSGSMIPTLNIGDRITANKYIYRLHPPQRGDIVVFKSPPAAQMHEEDFVKRLVGLPGETVELRGGWVFINGRPLKEPYVRQKGMTRLEPGYPGSLKFPFRVPPNRYLVLGDNRRESFDSRGWGVIEPWRIKGRAVFKFWPFSDFGALH